MDEDRCLFDDLDGPPVKVQPPLKWHGGKHYVFKKILALMPPHLRYVEPFFGAGHVLFARDLHDRSLWWPHPTSDGRRVDGVSECINDLNHNLMTFYGVLKNPDTFGQLQHRLQLTTLNEEEWEAAGALLESPGGDRVERAAALFVSVRQSRQALGRDFVTPVTTRLRGGRDEHVNAWWSAVRGLDAVHHRLQDVMVLCRDAVDVIRCQDEPSTFFYLDPPYFHETRTAKKAYGPHEMTDAQHRELLTVLKQVKGKVILSGYASSLYDDALAGWNRQTLDLPNNAASGPTKRRMTEVLWCNF